MIGIGVSPSHAQVSGPPLWIPLNAALVPWRQRGTRGKTLLCCGDSHTAVSPWGDFPTKFGSNWGAAGQQLDGISYIQAGEVGVKFSNVMNGTSVYNINWILTQNFDAIHMELGTNDVRDGSTSRAQLVTMIQNFVSTIHASKPNAVIILRTPNSFLSTDPTSSGYVTPLASAQAYTDILWNAYNDVVGTWPGYVAHYDTQTLTFGRTCQPTSAYMADIIHPNDAGYTASLAAAANLLVPRGWPFTGRQPATDIFLPELSLLLNGDSVSDASGHHTLTQSPSGVTASGGWLVFNGTAALKVLDNLSTFSFGKYDGTTNTLAGTIEIQCIPAVRSQPNGQVMLASSGGYQFSNAADPTNTYQVFGVGTTEGNGIATQGVLSNLAWSWGNGGRYACYKNGDATGHQGFVNADFTTGLAQWIGQETTGWAAVVYAGQLRMRITTECRYNNNATYTPYPGPWPTS